MRTDPSGARLRFDRFELDEAEVRLTRAGEPVALAPKPFGVLCALARRPGMLVTKDALLDDDPKEPRYIETVSRRGYRFIAGVSGASSQSAAAVERHGVADSGHPALTALTALCRCDAALAELIRSVAARLERERLVLNDS